MFIWKIATLGIEMKDKQHWDNGEKTIAALGCLYG
jgi:hypothetical protein